MTSTEALTDIIMIELRREVETLVDGISLDQDTLDVAEGKAREFAKACGAIAFNAHIQTSLKAQNYGHVGASVQLPDDKGRAYFERYESRWVATHVGRFRIKRAYYWNSTAGEGAIPLDEKWDLNEREPSPSLRRSIGMLGAEMPFRRGHRLLLQTALIDLPEKRMQESSEALGEDLRIIRQAATRETLPMLRDPNVGVPAVLPAARKGTLYIQMDGGRLNTTTENWREPKLATLYWEDDVVDISKDRRTILKKEHVAVLGDADELASVFGKPPADGNGGKPSAWSCSVTARSGSGIARRNLSPRRSRSWTSITRWSTSGMWPSNSMAGRESRRTKAPHARRRNKLKKTEKRICGLRKGLLS